MRWGNITEKVLLLKEIRDLDAKAESLRELADSLGVEPGLIANCLKVPELKRQTIALGDELLALLETVGGISQHSILPDITADDVNKVVSVDEEGEWIKSTVPEGE